MTLPTMDATPLVVLHAKAIRQRTLIWKHAVMIIWSHHSSIVIKKSIMKKKEEPEGSPLKSHSQDPSLLV